MKGESAYIHTSFHVMYRRRGLEISTKASREKERKEERLKKRDETKGGPFRQFRGFGMK